MAGFPGDQVVCENPIIRQLIMCRLATRKTEQVHRNVFRGCEKYFLVKQSSNALYQYVRSIGADSPKKAFQEIRFFAHKERLNFGSSTCGGH